VSVVN